ncbi:AAA family ATPase, partial [Leptolyngbya cf. ectocarpi LEGE 11479]
MSESSINWQVFRGDHIQDGERIKRLPPPPPWRQFRPKAKKNDADKVAASTTTYHQRILDYWIKLQILADKDENIHDRLRGEKFRIRTDQANVIQAVNAALSLRRPLLITGRPGSGKTSLAYAIAYELKLGPVLMWPVTARSTLELGLYRYDAIARLQDAQLRKQKVEANESVEKEHSIGDYIQLGPLGTAFLPTPYPRVLLIDEIDKSDINLPNDLLHLLEEGKFEIPELIRLVDNQSQKNSLSEAQLKFAESKPQELTQIRTADDIQVSIEGGSVRC